MNLDLNNLLGEWPHEPGQIKVRKIMGNDGKEKIQLRIDLGLIQMDVAGRPDGQRPHGCESLLEYHQGRALAKKKLNQRYTLNTEECAELQQEGIQYYHRYISFFQLNDYEGVIRDTQRNLDLFNFIARHVEREELAASLEQFRPYVIMMNTRAKAAIELDRNDFNSAVRMIEAGRERIVEIFQNSGNPELVSKSPEIAFLDEWLEEVRSKRPLTRIEIMKREMDNAIAAEAYEKAAELRDAIKAYSRKNEGD